MYVKVLETAGSLLQPPTSQRLKAGYVILKPGEQVGEHSTGSREEMLIILDGSARVECEGEVTQVHASSVVYIPRDTRHNVVNEGADVLKYIYLVTPVE